ncbi:hypothetical protein L596_014255 [Steinernema carpocapsae]|uniref:Aldehyde oxidase/xanthine dehydrogenase second molybdopterin binding domain-containing protein n=2 Tax=Steinernema carpocapsae TaxID=34508 RepID=A0A4U5NCH9_STECR|nr:hypothetical protein L596_014255 [Steinernema carpocapsae]
MDGSFRGHRGGSEMGQGLNIKCMQVAATVFGIPIEMVTMSEASTEKTPNAPLTGGSQGAGVHGISVKVACKEILELGFGQRISGALRYRARSTSRCTAPNAASLPRAACTGAACVSEVNLLTGSHKLVNVDIVMDAGVSLNPAIDIGQIEGAFIQGYGLLTTEEILWDEEGRFLTDAFQKYRIPTTATLPKKFRMMLLDKPNTYGVAIYSAKGTGEPLLLLGQSVFHAMERAVLAFAKNPQKVKPFASPLTSAKIRAYAKQYL